MVICCWDMFNYYWYRKDYKKVNYYYDIIVNFQQKNINYYEWIKTDELKKIEKVPLVQVSREDFLKIYINKIELSLSVLQKYFHKTIINGEKNTCILFCDRSNTIVIMFADDGKELNRSSLSYVDDENVCEIMYTTKKSKILFTLINKIDFRIENRKMNFQKKELISHINYLTQEKSFNQLSYYYIEIFSKQSNKEIQLSEELITYIDNIRDVTILNNIYSIIKSV